MIDLKVEEDIDTMLSPDIFTRFHGIENKVSSLINEIDSENCEAILIERRLLIDISYLLEEGRIASYKAENYETRRELHEISKTLKDILRELKKRKV